MATTRATTADEDGPKRQQHAPDASAKSEQRLRDGGAVRGLGMTPAGLRQLQRTYGNRAVQRLLARQAAAPAAPAVQRTTEVTEEEREQFEQQSEAQSWMAGLPTANEEPEQPEPQGRPEEQRFTQEGQLEEQREAPSWMGQLSKEQLDERREAQSSAGLPTANEEAAALARGAIERLRARGPVLATLGAQMTGLVKQLASIPPDLSWLGSHGGYADAEKLGRDMLSLVQELGAVPPQVITHGEETWPIINRPPNKSKNQKPHGASAADEPVVQRQIGGVLGPLMGVMLNPLMDQVAGLMPDLPDLTGGSVSNAAFVSEALRKHGDALSKLADDTKPLSYRLTQLRPEIFRLAARAARPAAPVVQRSELTEGQREQLEEQSEAQEWMAGLPDANEDPGDWPEPEKPPEEQRFTQEGQLKKEQQLEEQRDVQSWMAGLPDARTSRGAAPGERRMRLAGEAKALGQRTYGLEKGLADLVSQLREYGKLLTVTAEAISPQREAD